MAQNKKDNYQDNEFVQDNEPFKNDLLDREKIANNWINSFLSNRYSKVIAVDADWGMGKTYFARNLECLLLHNDYKVCYIDAFEYDFTDDPFMTITSNLIEEFEFTELEEISNKLNTFFRAFKGHLGAAVPALIGGAIKLVSSIPYVDVVAEIAGGITDATGKAVKETKNKSMNPADEVLQNDLSYNAAIKQFKNKLKELIKKQNSDKPFIVIVDELDRCKPTYAIDFLEKLKHLFDINNLVFLIFINHSELANAVKGVYGESFDGAKYLDKFFNLKLTFPKIYGNTLVYTKFIEKQLRVNLISDFFQKRDVFNDNNIFFDPYTALEELNGIIRFFQEVYQLSLRDIEHIAEILKYMTFKDKNDICHHVILRILYLHDKKCYNEFKKFDDTDFVSLLERMNTDKKIENIIDIPHKAEQYGSGINYIKSFLDIYDAVCDDEPIEGAILIGEEVFTNSFTPKDYMDRLINLIESIC